MRPERLDIIDDLRERLRRLEKAYRPSRDSAHATGTPLDQLLPGHGLAEGTLIEWLADGAGVGSATLALMVAARRVQSAGHLVVLDTHRQFYPPAAAELGVPLARTIVIQPGSASDALWALEQALRCRAVSVALAWIDALHDRAFRRLQLAAEKGGSLGFLLRPAHCRGEPSWAEMRLLVKAVPTPGFAQKGGRTPQADDAGQCVTGPDPFLAAGQRLQVEVLHCRGGAAGRTIELELCHEANSMPVVSVLGSATLPPRAAGA